MNINQNQKDNTSINRQKVAIIGCGFVGASCAFALMQSGMFSEMVLIDVDKNRAEGEAMDISHGMPFAKPSKIYAGDYDDIIDACDKEREYLQKVLVYLKANKHPKYWFYGHYHNSYFNTSDNLTAYGLGINEIREVEII